jgi:hypothetical protein
MLAIKADYQDGKIIFLENIPEKIKKARLTIVVEPEGETSAHKGSSTEDIDSEAAFKLIGLNEFFNENDNKIDWEDYFGIK